MTKRLLPFILITLLFITVFGCSGSSGDEDGDVDGDKTSVDGDNETVDGDDETIDGDNETVDGDDETIDGDDEAVDGDDETIDGDDETIDGDYETEAEQEEESSFECPGTVAEISCGQTISGDNSNRTNYFENYECFGAEGLDAGESIYQLTATCTGRLKLTLSYEDEETDGDSEEESETSDPEIITFVLSDCSNKACVQFLKPSNPFLSMYDTVRVEKDEVYYIVVDGWDGGVPFSLKTECLCDNCLDNDQDSHYGYDELWCPSGTDCNDNNNNVNPDKTEIDCDGLDNDCSEGDNCTHLVCIDEDNDSYYAYDVNSCPTGTDCNDSNNQVHPQATETQCDNIDQNCDGVDYCPGSGAECDTCDPEAEDNPCKPGYYCLGYDSPDIPFCVKDCTFDNQCPTGTVCEPYIDYIWYVCMPEKTGTCTDNKLALVDSCGNDLGSIDCGSATCNEELAVCQDSCPAIESTLSCGSAITDTNADGLMSFTDYSCLYEMQAREKVYQYTASCDGKAIVTLDPISAVDLDLLVLEGTCSNDYCSAYSAGYTEPEVLIFDLVNGKDYYVVVDSWSGHEGWYDLKLECLCNLGTVQHCATCEYDFECENNGKCVTVETGTNPFKYCAADCSSDGTCPENSTCTKLGSGEFYCIANVTASCDGQDLNALDACNNDYLIETCIAGMQCNASEKTCEMLSTCVDNDSDGFYAYDATLCPLGNDCNDDASTGSGINPGAEEILCNTTDEDCSGVDACPSGGQCGECSDGYCPDGYWCYKYPGLDTSFCAKDCTADYDCSEGTNMTCSSIQGQTPEGKYFCLPKVTGACFENEGDDYFVRSDSCGNELFTEELCEYDCYSNFGCYGDCDQAISTISTCGDTINSTTVGASNDNIAYNCDNYWVDGLYQGEKVYEYTAACNSEMTVTLKSEKFMHLMVVKDKGAGCKNYYCVDYDWIMEDEDAKVSFVAEAGAKYYFIVDSRAEEGDFELSFDCACFNCVDMDNDGYFNYNAATCPIGDDCNDDATSGASIYPGATETQCDNIDQDCDGVDSCTTCTPNQVITCSTGSIHSTTVGEDNTIQDYSSTCGPYPSTGGDRIYQITPNCNGTLRFDLSDEDYIIGYILDGSCSGNSCIARTGQGTLYADAPMVSGQTYYLVIDGYGGATSSFDMEAICYCD